jgi:hypothetical protein
VSEPRAHGGSGAPVAAGATIEPAAAAPSRPSGATPSGATPSGAGPAGAAPSARRWTFGLEPLPQTLEAAARLRRVASLVLALEHPDPRLDTLIDALDDAERLLAPDVPVDAPPRVGAAADAVAAAGTVAAADAVGAVGGGRAYLDHSRHIGAYNPCFPEYEIAVDGDHAAGTVTFPIAYEGPPGLVHGGFLAVFFDAAIQHHNCDVGTAGKTTALELRYRRPTPLLTELRFTLDRAGDGSRIVSTGELRHGDVVVCQARMEAVKGDRSRLPRVAPRRPLS